VRGPSARAVCVGRSPRRRAREQPEHWTMERAMAKVARDYLASHGPPSSLPGSTDRSLRALCLPPLGGFASYALIPVPPVRYRCAIWREHHPFLLWPNNTAP
jgi:hypothetical protein